jgi:hypothetical protein
MLGSSGIAAQLTASEEGLSSMMLISYHCHQLHAKFYPISFSQG